MAQSRPAGRIVSADLVPAPGAVVEDEEIGLCLHNIPTPDPPHTMPDCGPNTPCSLSPTAFGGRFSEKAAMWSSGGSISGLQDLVVRNPAREGPAKLRRRLLPWRQTR